MSNIETEANGVYADYNAPNDPASGKKKPDKGEIRALFGTVNDEMNAAQQAIQVLEESAGVPSVNFDTYAQLAAHTAYPENTIGFVNFDPTAALNGKYILKATSPPAWILTDDRVDAERNRAMAAEADLSLRDVLDERLARPRFLFVGDSIVQFNNYAETSGAIIKTQSRGFMHWCHAIWPFWEMPTWADPNITYSVTGVPTEARFFNGFNQGIAGDTTAHTGAGGGPSRVQVSFGEMADFPPDYVVYTIGINDVVQSVFDPSITLATINANTLTDINQFLQWGVKKVIIASLLPADASLVPAGAPLTLWQQVNSARRALPATMPNVVFWEQELTINDGSDRPLPGTTLDGIHPSTYGASLIGMVADTSLYSVIKRLAKRIPMVLPSDEENLVVNPRFNPATGGVVSRNCTGSVPANWTASVVSGAMTAVIASVPWGYTGGNLVDITFTRNGGVNNEQFKFAADPVDVSALVGKWIRIRTEVVVYAANNHFRQIEWAVDPARVGTPVDGLGDTFPTTSDYALTLEAEAYKVPVGATTITPVFTVGIDGTGSGAGGNMLILCAEVIIVDDVTAFCAQGAPQYTPP